MEYILYLSRFIYRIRWWLLLGTGAITLLAIILTSKMSRKYNVETTLYTGVVSGYSIEDGGGVTDWAATQNAMDNLINIIRAESTLKRVSLRLYARNLINGNAEKDNNYITAEHYRQMYNHVKNSPHGNEILALVDKTSEEKTVENLQKYEKPSSDNYIYGLFYYNHPHYSFEALKNIQVSRKGNSDLLEISYSADDAGIAYNTIDILLEEFVNEYRNIRYGETDKVIEYFRSELDRVGKELRMNEDSLTRYNVEKRVINYVDETREIAAINKEFELQEQDILFALNSSQAIIAELEKQMDTNMRQSLNNIQLVNKLKEASTLTGKISEIEAFSSSKDGKDETIKDYKKRLTNTRKELSDISDKYINHKYTKEGLTKGSIVEQWLDQKLIYERAKAELLIIQKSRQNLDEKYVFYAPVGSTIKRKERTISFTEQNYLSILRSYNEALMRKKNLEMTSATLKVLNSPAFPIQAAPTARKKVVAGAFAGSLFFILGFFLLMELLDRTLRDNVRTRRITGCKVLGSFPNNSQYHHRSFNKECNAIATRYMSSAILRFFNQRKEGYPYIVNFISTESQEGKSYLAEQLEEYWKGIGLKVKKLTWGQDFDANSRQFLLAETIRDLYTPGDEDILIVEYPNLQKVSIPATLLQEANLNLLVTRANRGWKGADKLLLDKLKSQAGNVPLYIYLNKTGRHVVEEYTGMLPPYNFFRKLMYRLSQLALTEKQTISPNKQQAATNNGRK